MAYNVARREPLVSSAAQKTWEGRVVAGKFPLRGWLGGSDHSSVFLTERLGQAPQKAAIKLVAADAGADQLLSRWRSAAQFTHPHLIRVFEAGRCQMDGSSFLYVATECASEDLSQILPERPLTPEEVADLLPPLLDAISYLHGKGFVHGRIRPSNILAVDDQLKLSTDQVTSVAEAGSRPRRDVYDAPETGEGTISPAADMWSLGVTIVTALTQKAPTMEGDRVPGLETLPEPFRGIARECLRVDPKRRCSIAQIQARLQPSGRSVPAAPEAPPVKQGSSFSKGGIAVAAGLAVLLIALAIFYPRGKSTPASSQAAPEPAPASSPAPAAAEPPPFTKTALSPGQVVRQVMPDIPQSAMNTITGTIKINARVEVDSSGKVTAAKLTSSGPSPYFARFTLEAAQRWEFTPPQVNGQPVASIWMLRFRLRHGGVQASAEKLAR